MFTRSFRRFFQARKASPITIKPRAKARPMVEQLEVRDLLSTVITQYSLSSSTTVDNTNGSVHVIAPSTDVNGGSQLALLNMNDDGGNTTNNADNTLTTGTINTGLSEQTLRVRGKPNNGWYTGAAEYSQGIEIDANTSGFSNIHFSFDWYATGSSIRDLEVQYNTNYTNSGGWTNLSSFVANSPDDFYNATKTPAYPTITVDLSSISGANNDANLGIRLVSAYDSTGHLGNEYASATLSNGKTVQYTNGSGNWRFDNLTFSSGTTTATTLSASPASPQNPGTTVTLSATVTPASGSTNPTGTVQFYDGVTPIGSPVSLTNGSGDTGVASITDGSLAAGPHNLYAVYSSGTSGFTDSASAPTSYLINGQTSTVVTATPASPQQVNTTVTFTATIVATGSNAPTGTVKFFDGSTQIGTTQNANPGSNSTSTASITISTLTSGVHNITAQYISNNNSQFVGSTSQAIGYAIYSGSPGPFTPGNLVLLQAGDGVNQYNAQAPLFLNEITTTGSNVQQVTIPDVGAATITAASESGTTVSVTTTNAPGMSSNGFVSGETIAIAGITPSGYDGQFVITATGANTFTYTAASGLGSANLSGATATPGLVGNQSITLDLSAAAGNGQLNRSYDGSALSFGGVDSTINNGGLTLPATPTGQNNRVIGVVTGDPTVTSNINTTTDGPFYVGDDNRGGILESPTGPLYTAGHPNQAGGAVSQGVHEFDTLGPSIGNQVSATTNVRGVTIGFDNRMYLSTAGGLGGTAALNTAGIFTEAQALPTSSTAAPANDIQVVPAIFSASKLGGVWVADVNGDGVVDNGDRLYFVDDGTVGGTGTGGLYVATWNDSNTQNPWNTPNNAAAAAAGFVDHWGVPVRLGDAPVQTGSGGVGQLRGLTGTVVDDGIASASESGTTVTITLSGSIPGSFVTGASVEISGVGTGYDGSWPIASTSGNSFTYTAATSGLGSVNPSNAIASQAILYTSAYDGAANDSSYIQQWVDTNTGVSIAQASESGSTVTITTLTPNTFRTGQTVEIDGVGANNGAGAITSGYNGAWTITVTDSTHFTYNDTNASGLSTISNQGAVDHTVGSTTVQQLASGSDTVNGKSYGDVGLRGVAFAPVAATNVTLTQTPSNPLNPGTTVTLTATLTNSQVTPSGTVAFIDENTNTVLGDASIVTSGGTSTATFSTVLVGNHYVQAYFSGGGTLALASARSNTIQVVEAGSTASKTTLTDNLSSAAIGKQVSFTATVVDNSGGSGTPTGSVSFYSGSVALANLLGTVPLSTVGGSQEAAFVTAFGAAGTQTVVAEYNGDNNFAISDGSANVSVAANATGVLTSSANNVALNAQPTYTATIVGNSTLGTPTGSVVFNIISATTDGNGNPLVTGSSGSINLSGSGNTATATWTSPKLSAPGSYYITISYTASGATNPYSSFAINTTTATSGVALIETVQQAFTPGNLIVVERGDGTVNLGSNAYPVFIDEWTTTGTLVQAIALPNVDSGTQHALFLSGQNGAEGLLNRSANGYDITVAGYDLPVGHTFITSTFPYQFPRTIAELNLAANVDTSTAIGILGGTGVPANISAASESGTTVTITTSAAHNFQVGQNIIIAGITPAGYDGSFNITSVPSSTTFTYTDVSGLGSATLNSATATPASVPYNPTDVVSNDGQEFWLASSLAVGDIVDSGIQYVGSLGANTATQIGPVGAAGAAISISGGQLYVTKGSGNIQAVGTGLPTTAGQSVSGLPNFATAYQQFFPNAANPEQVLLLNTQDGTTNNPNVAYVADQANGILKFWNNTAAISSLSESANTVTVTTSAANSLVSGQQVGISGASVAGYNGTFTITVVDSTHFTYTDSTSGLGNATGGTASQWEYGGPNGTFGQKLIFSGGATGITGYVVSPGANAQVQLYLTGSNVQQQNPNELVSFLDTHGAPAGSGSNGVDQGFPSGNVTLMGFVGGANSAGSPNGNENFAGLAFAPAYQTTTTVTSSAANGATEGSTVTFTATVVSAGGDTPAGVVQFYDGTTLLGQGTLNSSGVTTFVSGPLAAGVHTINATYLGSVKDGTSTGTFLQSMDFIASNLVVTRVGTGSSALNGNTTATFLDEYTNGGTSVSSTPLPTANSSAAATITTITESGTTATVTTSAAHGFAIGEKVTIAGSSVSGYNGTFTITAVTSTTFNITATSGLGSATGGTAVVTLDLTELGTATTEGYITDSLDGHSLSIAGYNAAPGGSNSGLNRDIAVVGPNAAVDLSTQLPSGTGSVRVAVSADGQGFWVATSTGIRYVAFGNTGAASTQVTAEVSSPTAIGIDTNNTSGTGSGTPGQLFASAGAGAQTNGVPALDSPFTVGAGAPQTAGSGIMVSPSFPTARDAFNNFPSTNQFAVSPDGNTIWIADSRTDSLGGIYEYFQASANSWTPVGHLQLNTFNISDAKESGTTVTITTSSAYSFPTGQTVEIDGVGTGYNGTFAITPVDSTHFTYTSGSSGLAEVTGAGVATSSDGGLRALYGDFSGSSPVLYATTTGASGNRLVKLTGGTLDGSNATFTASTLATAPTNTAFRGVAETPTAPGTSSTTTSLSVTGSPATYGSGVTLTATVSAGTGWVSFRAGGTEIGFVPVVSGTATFITAGNLPAGSYSNLTATYTGDSTHAASTSSAQSATVNQVTTGVTMSVSNNPVATGVNDTLTATLTSIPAGTAPTGTVQFQDGSTNIGSPATVTQVIVNQSGNPVIEFIATSVVTFSTVATHNLSAVYSGDNNFKTATGTTTVKVVNPTTTTVTTSNSNPTASPSSTVTYTATITSPDNTDTISGTVQFYAGLLPLGAVQTISGTSGVTASMTATTALLQSLQFAITSASESGNTVTITPVNPVPFTAGQSVTIEGVSVAGFNGGFTIASVASGGTSFTYTDPNGGLGTGTGGVATILGLTAGITSVTAIYTPDSAGSNNFFTSTGDYEQAVQSQPFTQGDQMVYRVGDGITPLNPPSPPSSVSGSIGSMIFIDDYHTAQITSTSESSNTVTVTTSSPSNFSPGQQVVIAGNSVAGYNGTWTILTVSGTTFTYTDSNSGLGSGSGGTAESIVESLALPTADGTGTQSTIHAVVGNGQQSSTGQMSLSGDGQYLFVSGYDNNPLNVATAAPIPTASGSAATPRSVARIKFDGTMQTVAMSATNSGSGFGNFNAVYSPDGNQFYVAGNGGVVYYSSFTPASGLVTPTATMTSPTGTTTALEDMQGKLAVIGAPGFGNDGPEAYSGFPTSAASVSSLPGFTDAAATAGGQASTFYIDAYFTHLNGSGAPAGINTFYLSDDGPSFAHGAITKWALVSGTWQVVDHITAGTGNSMTSFYYLSGTTDASGNVTLDVTYGNGGNTDLGLGQMGVVTDTNGYNAPIGTGGTHSDAVPIMAATSSTSNEVYRGVAAAPVPLVQSVITNSATTASITSATESSSTVTITTAAPHAFFVGEPVSIAGVGVAGYNGTWYVASVTATTFTYTDTNTGLGNSSGGTAANALAGAQRSMVDTVVYRFSQPVTLGSNAFTLAVDGTSAIGNATESSSTVTITTSAPETFAAGQTITVAGVGVAGYNGVWTIASVIDSTDFTYTDTNTGLANSNGGTVGVGTAPTVSYTSPDGGITWVATFSGNGVAGGSIADGAYNITLNAAAITVVTSGAGVAQTNRGTDTFFRLFGDSNGDQTVNNTDNRVLSRTFNLSAGQTGFVAAMDSNADGTINNTDNRAFSRRFNVSLTGFSPTI